MTVCYMLLIVTSLVANCIILVTVSSHKNLRSPMGLMLWNLCLAHFVSSAFVIPYVFVFDVGEVVSEPYWTVTCAVTESLQVAVIAFCVAMLMLIVIAYSRLVAIVFPFKENLQMTKCRVIVLNVLTWICCTASLLPSILSQKYYKQIRICLQNENTLSELNIPQGGFRILTTLASLGLLLPFLLLILSLAATVWKLYNNPVNRDEPDGKYRAAQLIGCFTLAYIISWLPYTVYWMWNVFGAPDEFRGGGDCESQIRTTKYRRIPVLFALVNDATDPLIYIFGVKDVKDVVKGNLMRLFRPCLRLTNSTASNQFQLKSSMKGNSSATLRSTVDMTDFLGSPH